MDPNEMFEPFELRPETPKPEDHQRQRMKSPPQRKNSGRPRSLTDILNAPEKTCVLLIGLDMRWSSQNAPDIYPDPERTWEIFKTNMGKLMQIEDLHIEAHPVAPDSRANIDMLKRKIRDGPGPDGGKDAWDGVLFGYSMRCVRNLNTLFEELINFVHLTLPGSHMLFSSDDEDFVEVMFRGLKIGQIPRSHG